MLQKTIILNFCCTINMLYKLMSQRYVTRKLHPSSQSEVPKCSVYYVKQKTNLKYLYFKQCFKGVVKARRQGVPRAPQRPSYALLPWHRR